MDRPIGKSNEVTTEPYVVSVRELPFVWSSFPRPATVIAGLLTVGLLFRFGWCQEWISRFASALALQLWTGLATTCLLFATLGLQFPWIDAELAAADRVLGFDTPGLIAWFAASPVITAWLYWAYSYQGLSAFVIAALAFIGRTDRLTEQMFIFSAGLVLASLLSIPFPAHGPFAHLAVPSSVFPARPSVASSARPSGRWSTTGSFHPLPRPNASRAHGWIHCASRPRPKAQ